MIDPVRDRRGARVTAGRIRRGHLRMVNPRTFRSRANAPALSLAQGGDLFGGQARNRATGTRIFSLRVVSIPINQLRGDHKKIPFVWTFAIQLFTGLV